MNLKRNRIKFSSSCRVKLGTDCKSKTQDSRNSMAQRLGSLRWSFSHTSNSKVHGYDDATTILHVTRLDISMVHARGAA